MQILNDPTLKFVPIQNKDLQGICICLPFIPVIPLHRTHMLNLEKQGLVQPLRFGKNRQLRLYERDAVRELVRQERAAPDGRAEKSSPEKPTPLPKNRHDWLPLPDEDAVNGGPPRLTWESFWEGKLEGWEEVEPAVQAAEARPATKPAGS